MANAVNNSMENPYVSMTLIELVLESEPASASQITFPRQIGLISASMPFFCFSFIHSLLFQLLLESASEEEKLLQIQKKSF